jgi:hypothetical protein
MPRPAKGEVNRSEAIREHLKMVPKASHADIKQALLAKGIKVSDSLISAVKYKKPTGKKRGRKKGSKVAAVAARKTTAKSVAAKLSGNLGANISVETLIAASKMVQSLGGLEKAARAIEVLKRLQG